MTKKLTIKDIKKGLNELQANKIRSMYYVARRTKYPYQSTSNTLPF